MEDFFSYIRSRWNTFTAIAIWLFAIAGTFIINPPLLSYTYASTINAFSRFIIAGLIAIIFIPLRTRSKKVDYRYWYRLGIFLFILCVCISVFYSVLLGNWSTRYYNNTRLVSGKTMLTEAVEAKKETAKKLDKPFIDDETFVKARQGETQYIWEFGELQTRFYILSLLYVLSTVFVSFFIIVIFQSIYLYEKDN